ncbi:DDE Tnp4 domain-containing protein [Trichonephila clavipes]|nr:DDE Tnp4 domain-containing protein [Trichonephila clavipes]
MVATNSIKMGTLEMETQFRKLNGQGSYRRFLRMDASTFEELVALVSPSIERKNISMRNAIPAAERIALTLKYLTTGERQSSLSYQFRIAQNTMSGIIPAVCAAIYHHLGSKI